MTGRIFFDTNILVYLFDTSDKSKNARAKSLISEGKVDASLHISSQVINEFINITTRKIKNPINFERQKDILKFLNVIFIVNPLTIHTSQKAISLKLKYKYAFWDALILASAIENNCDILYSEDMQHGQLIEGGLKITSPF